jgi:hypothetical protein
MFLSLINEETIGTGTTAVHTSVTILLLCLAERQYCFFAHWRGLIASLLSVGGSIASLLRREAILLLCLE